LLRLPWSEVRKKKETIVNNPRLLGRANSDLPRDPSNASTAQKPIIDVATPSDDSREDPEETMTSFVKTQQQARPYEFQKAGTILLEHLSELGLSHFSLSVSYPDNVLYKFHDPTFLLGLMIIENQSNLIFLAEQKKWSTILLYYRSMEWDCEGCFYQVNTKIDDDKQSNTISILS
jgi:hypothetical protein